ncbi:MAG: hypothetical protein ABIV51_00550 [Saprospiraceae bacterium]
MKKWLIGIFTLLLAALIVFLALGYFNSPMSINSKVSTTISIDTAFSAYRNPAIIKHWMKDLDSIRLIKGLNQQAGAIYLLDINQQETSYQMDYTLLQMQEPATMHFRLENEALRNNISVHFTSTEAGTTVERKEEIEGKTAFMKSALFLMRKTLEQQSKRELERFAQYLTTNK